MEKFNKDLVVLVWIRICQGTGRRDNGRTLASNEQTFLSFSFSFFKKQIYISENMQRDLSGWSNVPAGP
jgi:hypothetical protein